MILDEDAVASHRQLHEYSCIPMAIEYVLKLLRRLSPTAHDLQQAWGNRQDGDFSVFDNALIHGVRFRRQFWFPRGENFPLGLLFHTIDAELAADKHVIIALPAGKNWHNYIIYKALLSGEYKAITKGASPETIDNVRELVLAVQGTDIMTYTIEGTA
jgi:hypothetical protein